MIIQGSNNPIILEYDSPVDKITDISVVLTQKGSLQCNGSGYAKQWRMADVQKSGKTILLPLTQYETLSFMPGKYDLEVKWIENDSIIFARVVTIYVEPRSDRTQFMNVKPGSKRDELVQIKMTTAVIKNGHSPYINEETLTWMVYDDALEKYIDTGVNASPPASIIVDDKLSLESVNPVQNKVITEKLSNTVDSDDLVEITASQIDDIWESIDIGS